MVVKKIPCEIYSRIVGYYAPVARWNAGKKREFKDRKEYSIEASMSSRSVGKHEDYNMRAQLIEEGVLKR